MRFPLTAEPIPAKPDAEDLPVEDLIGEEVEDPFAEER